MAKKKSIHYVDNKKFHEEMVAYKTHCADVKNDDPEALIPIIPDYIGDCFMKIAERLSLRPNFVNYAFRDEMISDGIENCLQYVKNFNPEKSNNPFAYFTQIIYYAFLRRIAKEKKQSHIKNKMIEKDTFDSYTTMDGDDTSYTVPMGWSIDNLPDEDVYKPKKKDASKKGLENFMEKDS